MISRFYDMLLKDMKLIFKNRVSFTLIFLGPLFITLIVGGIMSSTTTSAENMKMDDIPTLICDMDQDTGSQEFIRILQTNYTYMKLTVENSNCDTNIQSIMKERGYFLVVIFPKNFTKRMEDGKFQNVRLYYDNSKNSLGIIQSVSITGIGKVSEKFGKDYIGDVLDNMEDLQTKIDDFRSQIDTTKGDVERMKQNIESSKESLIKLNMTEFEENLGEMKQKTVDFSNATDDKISELNKMKKDVNDQYNKVAESSKKVQDAGNLITTTGGSLTTLKGSLTSLMNNIIVLKQYMTDPPQIIQAEQTITTLNTTIGQIDSTHAQIGQLSQDIDSIGSDVSGSASYLNSLGSSIGNTIQDLTESRTEVQDVQNKLGDMETTIGDIEESRSDNIKGMDDAIQKTQDLLQKLDDVKPDLDKARSNLGEFTSRGTEGIIKPLEMESTDLFKQLPYFHFRVGGVLGSMIFLVVVLMTALDVMNERRIGALKRLQLSPTPTWLQFISILISYTVVTTIITGISLYTSQFIFGFEFTLMQLPALFFCGIIMGIPSILFGTFLGTLSKNENVAIILTITVGLPLIFISGFTMAFEFMPPLLSMLGRLTPIAVGNAMIFEVIFHKEGIPAILSLTPPILVESLILLPLAIHGLNKKIGR